jgi:hypothetical protein
MAVTTGGSEFSVRRYHKISSTDYTDKESKPDVNPER